MQYFRNIPKNATDFQQIKKYFFPDRRKTGYFFSLKSLEISKLLLHKYLKHRSAR